MMLEMYLCTKILKSNDNEQRNKAANEEMGRT